MSEKIFEKDFSYRARVTGKDGVIMVRPEEKGKPQLMVPEKSGDMVGEMKKQFDEFVAEMGGTPSPDPMERPLTTQDPRLEVWLSKERHELVVKKTVKLNETPDYGTEISNLEAELRRCLLINRTSVLNACRAR